MGDAVEFELPAIVELNHFRGNIDTYIEHIYNAFIQDFFTHKVHFRGKQVKIIIYPKDKQDREYSFVHSTSVGPCEEDREWDLRRSERVCWIKPLIELADSTEEVMVWKNVRRKRRKKKAGTVKSIHTQIYYLKENFLISLEETNDSWKLLSCYRIFPEYKRKKYIKEFEEFSKTGVPVDGIDT